MLLLMSALCYPWVASDRRYSHLLSSQTFHALRGAPPKLEDFDFAWHKGAGLRAVALASFGEVGAHACSWF